MANQLLTISMITREALRVLENNLVAAARVERQYSDQFAKTGAKIGNTINIRKPPRFTRTDGQGLALQDVTETSVPLVLTTQGQRAFTFSSADLALSIDDFSKRFVKPAVASLANQVDYDILQLFSSVWNSVGVPGTTPNALLTYLQAVALLKKNAVPVDDELYIVIDPTMEVTIVDALKGLFHESSQIEEQYAKGKMGRTIGCEWAMDQNVANYTTGGYGGAITPNVSTAPVSGATTLSTQGWTGSTSTVAVGDVFTIGGGGTTPVYMVNPQNYTATSTLQQFVVTAAATASGGNMTINFSPAITTSGAFQTVNQLPTTGSTNGVLTFAGPQSTLTTQGMAFHRLAFALGSADLPLPGGVDMASRISEHDFSIRAIRAYDINQDRFPLRLDFLYGVAPLYPQLASRIQG